MKREVWKDIPGYDGIYQVSDLGRVRSLKRGSWKFLKSAISGTSSYRYVQLHKDSSVKNRPVHQLVLEAFVGQRPAGDYQGCHNDGDSGNNSLSNLRWDTQAGNFADKKLHGTESKGSKHGQAKLNESQVLNIRRRLNSGEKQQTLADEHGVSRVLISLIKTRKVWTHI